MTRKLLMVEIPANSRLLDIHMIEYGCRYLLDLQSYVHDLPTAEELGRVALKAHYQEHDGLIGLLEPAQRVGQAILDALTKPCQTKEHKS